MIDCSNSWKIIILLYLYSINLITALGNKMYFFLYEHTNKSWLIHFITPSLLQKREFHFFGVPIRDNKHVSFLCMMINLWNIDTNRLNFTSAKLNTSNSYFVITIQSLMNTKVKVMNSIKYRVLRYNKYQKKDTVQTTLHITRCNMTM